MVRLFVAAVFVCLLFDPAGSASLDAAAINNADFRGKPPAEDKVDTAVVKVQILLDRAMFSPGKLTASSPKIPKRPCEPTPTRKA